MSTVAFRHGVMAADSGAWLCSGSVVMPFAQKLVKGNDNCLYGAVGQAAGAEAYFQWVKGGYQGQEPLPIPCKDDSEQSRFVILRAHPAGEVSLITAFGVERYPAAPYLAIGPGAAVALGALWAGASAVEAISAALVHADAARGEVRSISFQR